MKVSYNWLNNYLKIPVDLKEVSDILTSIGLEVEGVDELFSSFDHLVVGKVLECYNHPNADKLKITKVDIGSEIKQIVCGASNVKKNQLVVVVLAGNELYNNSGDKFKIKKTKIRGELSEGMICAEDEIGLGDGHDGIIEINKNVEIGSMAANFFDIQKDHSLEIGLTPNRTDAFSHIGICKDLYAYFSHNGYNLTLNMPSTKEYVNESDLSVELKVNSKELCPKYLGVCLENVEIKSSPNWLKNRLISIGLKPINNVVDVTNFVLHETGNPLHAFDCNKILDSKLIVREANQGEQFETLDLKSIKLNSEDLVICDEEKVLCLAGVMGGACSGVTDDTTDVFLESAFFHPESVRKTSKRHAINSDSSYRFERGVDFENCEYALKRAALLIKELTGCSIGKESRFSSSNLGSKEVDFSFQSCSKILGYHIPNKTILEILVSLGFEVISVNNDICRLSVPTYRADVYREIDVIEEVLRIYGYDNLPASKYVKFQPLTDSNSAKFKLKDSISQLLVSDGFFEMKNNSLVKEEVSSLFSSHSESEIVKLLNPLSQDLGVMRTNMFVSGLETMKYNLNRQMDDLKLFEFGKTYYLRNKKYVEDDKLTIFTCGKFKSDNWGDKSRDVDFFLMKGVLNKLLDRFLLKSSDFKLIELDKKYSEFGLLYSVKDPSKDRVGDCNIFEIGLFTRGVLNKVGIKKPIYYLDIDLDKMINLINRSNIKYKPVSKFPSITRDLSLLVPKSVSYLDIETTIKQISNHLLQEVSLFDVYEGEGVEKGKKSYAISFLFRDELGTLQDTDIDKEMFVIFSKLKSKYNIVLRDGELKSN
ncbi:MAG: phenylalanine--tRNA ligase subunit beta [Flavobacteriales bacterium]|nr:phenylalanine--tRNA ligase subunit beta [Flavobacteriales bacterium]